MKADTRHFLRGPLAAVAAVLMLAMPAYAQSADDPSSSTTSPSQQLESANDQPLSQVPSPIPTVQPQLKPAFWATTAGFEGDTHNTGYAFIGPSYSKPIRRNVSLIGGANMNYLYYQYPSGSDNTMVRSPGVSARGGVKLGDQNYVEFGAGPSVKRRHTEVRDINNNVLRSFDDTIVGLNLGSEVWVDPTKHNNVYGILDYSTQDGYLWTRLAYKEQISNLSWNGSITPYLGIEGTTQGNRDVRSNQFGPFFEVVHVPTSTSIMFRGGWKRSTYQVGPDKTGPWFAIGFWHRL